MRATIYARYSTDKQRESSIQDQARQCHQRAEAEGFKVVATHSDDGISGSTPVARRPGGTKLLADALADRFDVLVVEGLDRLSRDQVEQESIVRRLEHRGIVIIGIGDGYDSRMGGRKIMRGVRGLINELYLDDLRHKTHRGQSGQVDRGFVAGGKSYGYRIIKADAGSTYEIDSKQAKWVRWIFERYADGWSVQRIAHELNHKAVPSPRASTWAVSALYGAPNKGSGILNNELYIGRYIWNRSQWVKDPDTGKRQRIDRPKEEWKITDVPELRIVDDSLWHAARLRMDAPRMRGGRTPGRPTRTLFGGLMKCPHCGGAVVAINTRQYGCTTRKDRGPAVCQGVLFNRDHADRRFLGILREDLLSRSAQDQLQERVTSAVARRRKETIQSTATVRMRMLELDAEIKRLVDAIATIGLSDALQARLAAAETERARLRADQPVPGKTLTPADVTTAVKRMLLNLQSGLDGDVEKARKAIGELFGEIQILEEPDGIYAEYDNAVEKLLLAANGVSLIMVAGTRIVHSRQRILLVSR